MKPTPGPTAIRVTAEPTASRCLLAGAPNPRRSNGENQSGRPQFWRPDHPALTSLLASGAKGDCESGDGVSPLPKAARRLVNSVTALCSPNNGSTLFLILDKYKLTDTILDMVACFAGLTGHTSFSGSIFISSSSALRGRQEETDIAAMKDALQRVLKRARITPPSMSHRTTPPK